MNNSFIYRGYGITQGEMWLQDRKVPCWVINLDERTVHRMTGGIEDVYKYIDQQRNKK